MEVLPVYNNNTNYKNSTNEDFDYCDYTEESAQIEALTVRLEQELRTAKKMHLSAGEILLPSGLTRTLAQQMYKLGDSEPCGLRGGTLYITFEAQSAQQRQKISQIKCDPTVPTTFELFLTLKEATAGWNNFIPQFFKKITRGGTVMISPDYTLQKKKLYRSSYATD